jgi:hypothetical protein
MPLLEGFRLKGRDELIDTVNPLRNFRFDSFFVTRHPQDVCLSIVGELLMCSFRGQTTLLFARPPCVGLDGAEPPLLCSLARKASQSRSVACSAGQSLIGPTPGIRFCRILLRAKRKSLLSLGTTPLITKDPEIPIGDNQLGFRETNAPVD